MIKQTIDSNGNVSVVYVDDTQKPEYANLAVAQRAAGLGRERDARIGQILQGRVQAQVEADKRRVEEIRKGDIVKKVGSLLGFDKLGEIAVDFTGNIFGKDAADAVKGQTVSLVPPNASIPDFNGIGLGDIPSMDMGSISAFGSNPELRAAQIGSMGGAGGISEGRTSDFGTSTTRGQNIGSGVFSGYEIGKLDFPNLDYKIKIGLPQGNAGSYEL